MANAFIWHIAISSDGSCKRSHNYLSADCGLEARDMYFTSEVKAANGHVFAHTSKMCTQVHEWPLIGPTVNKWICITHYDMLYALVNAEVICNHTRVLDYR